MSSKLRDVKLQSVLEKEDRLLGKTLCCDITASGPFTDLLLNFLPKFKEKNDNLFPEYFIHKMGCFSWLEAFNPDVQV